MIPIKNPSDLEQMRLACQAARAVLDALVPMVRPGVSTKEIDEAAGERISAQGCRSAFLGYRGFPGQICISLNEQVVHGIGGTRRIQFGDLVKLDVGVVRRGWVGDVATSVPVGDIKEEGRRLLGVSLQALEAGIAQAVAGNRVGDISAAVEHVVLAAGYSVVREFAGHGVGRKLHEEPQVPNHGQRGTGPRLKEGMTLAIEPMVNVGRGDVRVLSDGWTVVSADRSLSAHVEHTVLVRKGRPEILTCQSTVPSPAKAS